jgi:hypothetical protein
LDLGEQVTEKNSAGDAQRGHTTNGTTDLCDNHEVARGFNPGTDIVSGFVFQPGTQHTRVVAMVCYA